MTDYSLDPRSKARTVLRQHVRDDQGRCSCGHDPISSHIEHVLDLLDPLFARADEAAGQTTR